MAEKKNPEVSVETFQVASVLSDFELKIIEDIINQFKPPKTLERSSTLEVDDAFLDRDFYQIFQNITNTTGLNEWQERGFINNNKTTKPEVSVLPFREYEMNISL